VDNGLYSYALFGLLNVISETMITPEWHMQSYSIGLKVSYRYITTEN
jgi:hypothetical protein